jgi:hypothetical protein
LYFRTQIFDWPDSRPVQAEVGLPRCVQTGQVLAGALPFGHICTSDGAARKVRSGDLTGLEISAAAYNSLEQKLALQRFVLAFHVKASPTGQASRTGSGG